MIKGVRLYRSIAPQRNYNCFLLIPETEVKIYYLDDANTFQEISGGSVIPTGAKNICNCLERSVVCCFPVNSLCRLFSHTGSAWARADITGLTHKPGLVYLHRDRLWVCQGRYARGLS